MRPLFLKLTIRTFPFDLEELGFDDELRERWMSLGVLESDDIDSARIPLVLN